MRIYVIRHSVRETPDDFSDAEEGDPEAELTGEGQTIAKTLGAWMAASDAIPSRIIASDAVRAQQTAELIAQEIESAGYAAPDVETDVGIGPHMSIRGCVLEQLAEGDRDNVAIVSHKDSIRSGMQQLSEDADKPDPMAMGELRAYKVKRKSGKWREEKRVLPSDLGQADHY